MTEIEEYIKDWVQRTSEIRPELGNFALCPYSSTAKYIVIESNADEIGPIAGYDIVFFVIEDYLDLMSVQFWVNFYNTKYPEWIFFEDCPENETFIKGIATSNGKYNIITMQSREKLRKSRQILVNTGYYHHWNDELLQEIVGEDYEMVKKRDSNPEKSSV